MYTPVDRPYILSIWHIENDVSDSPKFSYFVFGSLLAPHNTCFIIYIRLVVSRAATVPVSVPFSVLSKICKNFHVLWFLSVLNNQKFFVCDGPKSRNMRKFSILSYPPILANRSIQKVPYKQKGVL